jgi:hypothetical protein
MRYLAAIAIGVCAFVSACLLLDRLLPARDLPWLVREKVAHMATHGNQYDALFLGSSRVENNIIPALFDRTAAERGLVLQSFNAGISGMYPPQDAYVLDRLLAAKPAHLRWVFVELQYLQTVLPRANRGTIEQVYWHDWARFALLYQHEILKAKKQRHWQDGVKEAVDRLPELSEHALLFAQYFTNLGRGAVLLHRWVFHEPVAPADERALGEFHDGWAPAGMGEIRNEQTVARLDRDLQERRTKPPTKDFRDAVTQKAFDQVIARIERAGATPVLVVPPNAARGNYFYPDPKRARQLLVLDFCDPTKYPELYATENRVDTSHLTPGGAQIFTRLLAERFVELEQAQHRGSDPK